MAAALDLTGRRFGRLTAREIAQRQPEQGRRFLGAALQSPEFAQRIERKAENRYGSTVMTYRDRRPACPNQKS